MLPGFRFLFTAIVLSLSILVFGLGAAALLRAAHEEFASNPSWHATPETTFAQQGEATRPVLALLRVDTPAVDAPQVEKPSGDVLAASAGPAQQTAINPTPAEPEQVAALRPEGSSPPEPAIPASESLPPREAATAPDDAPATADQTKTATAAEPSPPASETASAAPAAPAVAPAADAAPAATVQMPAAASPNPSAAATKIATLGGPPITIEPRPPGKLAGAKPDRSVTEKRLRARRAALRRRMAGARLARQALLQQQAANPFLQPAIQPGVQPAIQPTNR
jgi:hypothetical protein